MRRAPVKASAPAGPPPIFLFRSTKSTAALVSGFSFGPWNMPRLSPESSPGDEPLPCVGGEVVGLPCGRSTTSVKSLNLSPISPPKANCATAGDFGQAQGGPANPPEMSPDSSPEPNTRGAGDFGRSRGGHQTLQSRLWKVLPEIKARQAAPCFALGMGC